MKWAAIAQNTSAGVPPACLVHYRSLGEGWRCFFAQYAAPFVQSPLFALQSQFDAYQTSAMIRSRDSTIVDPYAMNLSNTLELSLGLLGSDAGAALAKKNGRNGAFLNACWHHSGAWPRLQISGVTAWDAMATWYIAFCAAPERGNKTGGQRYWKQSAPAGFLCKATIPFCRCRSRLLPPPNTASVLANHRWVT
eukprot:SAG11_NODE_511_length_8847_cov_3.611911_10_plen_194_part_00